MCFALHRLNNQVYECHNNATALRVCRQQTPQNRVTDPTQSQPTISSSTRKPYPPAIINHQLDAKEPTKSFNYRTRSRDALYPSASPSSHFAPPKPKLKSTISFNCAATTSSAPPPPDAARPPPLPPTPRGTPLNRCTSQQQSVRQLISKNNHHQPAATHLAGQLLRNNHPIGSQRSLQRPPSSASSTEHLSGIRVGFLRRR